VSASTPNLFSCRLIAVVIAGREVLMIRKRHTGLWDLPGGDLRVGEHPEAGIRRIVESDSSTVVAITGLGRNLQPQHSTAVPGFSVPRPSWAPSDRDQRSSNATGSTSTRSTGSSRHQQGSTSPMRSYPSPRDQWWDASGYPHPPAESDRASAIKTAQKPLSAPRRLTSWGNPSPPDP